MKGRAIVLLTISNIMAPLSKKDKESVVSFFIPTPLLRWALASLFLFLLTACPESVTETASICIEGQVEKCTCDDGREGVSGCENGEGFGDCHCMGDEELEPNTNPDGGVEEVEASVDAGNVPVGDSPCQDNDDDGFYDCIDPNFPGRPQEVDCDDSFWLRQPGGFEYPDNGIDDNCDGQVDERPTHCDCPSEVYNTPENLARAINLCDGFTTGFSFEGSSRQKLWSDNYETILPRAGGCVSVLSTGATRRTYENPTLKYTSSTSTLNSILKVTFDGNEEGSTFKCQIDNEIASLCSSPYVLPVLEPGIHEMKVWAIDTSGLEDPIPLLFFWESYFEGGGKFIHPNKRNDFPIAYQPLELTWPVDSAILSDTTPAVFGYAAANRQVKIEFEKDGEVAFTKVVYASGTGRWVLDSLNWSHWGASQSLESGTYLLTVSISESAGGAAGAEEVLRMIEINETVGEPSPIVTKIDSLIETSVQNYEVTFSSDSEPEYFECRLDEDGVEGAWEPCASPKSYNNLGEKMYQFHIRAHSDSIMEPIPVSRKMRVRAHPFSILSPSHEVSTLERLPAIFGGGPPGKSVTYTLTPNNSQHQTYTGNAIISFLGEWVVPVIEELPEDTYTLDVERNDGTDNPETLSVTFTIDAASADSTLPLTVYYEGRTVQPGTNLGIRQDDPDPVSPSISDVRDLAVLELEITKPGNARGFSFDFMFLSAEFPEFMCKSFNDTFYALLQADNINFGHPQNVSFDTNGNEVTVNNAFFEPGNGWTVDLSDTPFGGYRSNYCGVDEEGGCYAPEYCAQPDARNVTGSGTGWLKTVVPLADEISTFTISFSVHDEGDGIYDSTALIDNFTWLTVADEIVTEKPVD